MIKKISVVSVLLIAVSLLFIPSSCKYFKKEDKPLVAADTTVVSTAPVNTINLPHADTAIIPVLAKVLDEAFDASNKKDYNKLATLIVYHGPDANRSGYDVFTAKNSYEKKVIVTTADVFNKWNRNIDTRDYGRVFSLNQPDGSLIPVLEVIFVSKKSIDRKFFILMQINGAYKIADVTSHL